MIILRLVICFSLLFALQMRVQAVNYSVKEPLKVGFIMGGPISDSGWNEAHNDGRLYLEKAMKDKVQTVFAEKIPESSDAARVMERMIAQGTKVIFLTTYGYLDPAIAVAKRHPDVIFMQINRICDKPMPNIGSYYPQFYEPMYVSGFVTGKMTKSNNIGYIIGHPVPNLFVTMNAFTMGARSINPNVHVHVVCTNSWSDVGAEVEATRGLIEQGADIIVSHLDSALTSCLTASKAGVYSVGTHMDLNKKIPKTWLTGQAWNYGPVYTKIVQSIIDGSWKPISKSYGLNDDCVRLSSFGQSVPRSVRTEALGVLRKIKEGKLVVFEGPIKDKNGKIRVPIGEKADQKVFEQMNWVVPGVEGHLAK